MLICFAFYTSYARVVRKHNSSAMLRFTTSLRLLSQFWNQTPIQLRACCSTFSAQRAIKQHQTYIGNAYRNLFPWRNEVELAKMLASNIVHKDETTGLIAIVKPYGLPIHPTSPPSSSDKHVHHSLLSAVHGTPQFSIAQVLDYLAQILRVDRLFIVKCNVPREIIIFIIGMSLRMECC